ncbi:hypothetical protein [Mesorhizobium sp.]|uniref:hypothetical protein n=1 Tax=Mesorhizobium sp. TaxID=1871066 RepID=UPI002580A184|nr:hypothetical protein [Mesorhizobium sp.]
MNQLLPLLLSSALSQSLNFDGTGLSPSQLTAALKLVRLAIEQTCPAGVLPSEEAVLLLYGPEPIHEGEALAKAIIETVARLERRDSEKIRDA